MKNSLTAKWTNATVKLAQASVMYMAIIFLSGCGDGVSGTYVDKGENLSISITFDGKQMIQKMWQGQNDSDAQEVRMPYELDGKKIIVGGTVYGTIQDDGSIKGSMATLGGNFIKQ